MALPDPIDNAASGGKLNLERYLREVLIPRIAQISPHQIMNFIAERVLELPKSY